jgi:hypothetical protein
MSKILNEYLNLEFKYCFGFRISCFGFPCKARHRLLVNVWFQVLFHRPHRAAFHLSLAVLVHYRCVYVFSLGGRRGDFACAKCASRLALVPPVSCPDIKRGSTQVMVQKAKPFFRYGTITLCGRPFQNRFPKKLLPLLN